MTASTTANAEHRAPPRKDRTHYLYIAVIVAVIAGIAVGLIWPSVGVALRPLGTGFVNLIKMLISPVIFCTIVLGVGSIRQAAKVGKVGGLALGYFLVMSTVALAIGLVVGNLLHPGAGLHLTDALRSAGAKQAAGEPASTVDFVLGIIPTTLFSALTSGVVLQTLFVALLIGFAVQMLGQTGEALLRGVKHLERLVFRIMSMVMWLAPVGAFGAIAAVVGATGWGAIASLAQIMAGFYVTCLLFVVVFLGLLLRFTTGVSIFGLLKYLAREFLLILSTSSSESALPRLVAKMEHMGVSRSVVGITVPTGYSFNLDGTAIYLTMASLFIAEALGKPLAISEQLSLLLFMIIASKGAAGVTGAGLAVLAGGLQSHRPDLVEGVGLIVGIDRFMSEARALTNFAGNAVATVIIGKWVGEFDPAKADRVLKGEDPFDEATMIDEEEPAAAKGEPTGAVGDRDYHSAKQSDLQPAGTGSTRQAVTIGDTTDPRSRDTR
jgi:aerobic C4-dicarboxylate transport protein